MADNPHIDVKGWTIVVQPGIVDTSDAGNIDRPGSIVGIADVDDELGSRVFTCFGCGNLIVAQLVYPRNLVVSVDPVVVLFGRYDKTQPWDAVTSKANKQLVTLKTNADTGDTAFKRTILDNEKQAWNSLGNNQFAFGVATALDGTVGNKALAFIRAKVCYE